MAILDFHLNFNIWLRWLHVLAGIIWLGQLYFLDFALLPLVQALGNSPEHTELPEVIRRAAWWLRWSAMTSVTSGVLLFIATYFYAPGARFGPTPLLIAYNQFTDRSVWILFGMATAMVMWFNVWFVIWPSQKHSFFRENPSSEHPKMLRRRSLRAVRTNTLLSGPVLFAMLAPSHFGSIDLLTWLIIIAVAIFVMWGLAQLAGVIARAK